MIFSDTANTKSGSWKDKLTIRNFIFTICILIIALFINCTGSIFATNITFPLYLDSVLTIGVTAMAGLFPGILCAILSNGLLTFLDYTMLPFMTCHIITAVLAWLVFRNEDRKNSRLSLLERKTSYGIEVFLWAGLWSALSNGILGNIIADTLFGARVNRQNAECTVQGIYIVTRDMLFSIYFAGFIENITDKMLSATASFGFYEIGRRIYEKTFRKTL